MGDFSKGTPAVHTAVPTVALGLSPGANRVGVRDAALMTASRSSDRFFQGRQGAPAASDDAFVSKCVPARGFIFARRSVALRPVLGPGRRPRASWGGSRRLLGVPGAIAEIASSWAQHSQRRNPLVHPLAETVMHKREHRSSGIDLTRPPGRAPGKPGGDAHCGVDTELIVTSRRRPCGH